MHRFADTRYLRRVTKLTPSNQCVRSERGSHLAWPNLCQPVANNASPTLSALSPSIHADHPIDKRRQPLNRQVERVVSCARHRQVEHTVSCARHGCLCVHRHVNCPRTHWCTLAARNNHMAFSLEENCAYTNIPQTHS
jgi:hypothetical protein